MLSETQRWLLVAAKVLLSLPMLTCRLPAGDVDTGAGDAPDRAAEATYIGEALCRTCHVVEAEHWSDTLHADVFQRGARSDLERRGCEACHGPGSRHLQNPVDPEGLVGFTRDAGASVETQNGMCLTCHSAGARLHWAGSAHEVQEVACADCHNPMTRTSRRGLLRESTVRETCFACHPTQRLQFRKRSHMPLFEGKIECTDCHDPHGSVADPLLRGDTIHELCTGCHAEKRGPFLWEHAPVTESCLNCHDPHGSNRDFLLSANPPFLCQECHAQIGILNHPTELLTRGNLPGGAVEDERIMGRACVTCHVQIHGSNHPAGARFHR
jgi:DmsE family decaheme c-type cytochrome